MRPPPWSGRKRCTRSTPRPDDPRRARCGHRGIHVPGLGLLPDPGVGRLHRPAGRAQAIALSPALVAALEERYRSTSDRGDDEFVFCHPKRGTRYSVKTFAGHFRAALKAAGVEGYVRPFHDLRHSSITNGAAAGESPIALMTRAGTRT